MLGHNLHDLTFRGDPTGRFITDERETVRLDDVQHGSCFAHSEHLNRMRGKSVLLLTTSQLATVLALIELGGIAGRLLLATPDLVPHLMDIIQNVDFVVSDDDLLRFAYKPEITTGFERLATLGIPIFKANRKIVSHGHSDYDRDVTTEWVLFTSGTTSAPKMVRHSLLSLSGPIQSGAVTNNGVWSTFYDVRRYGGLQILLRALIGGGSLILSAADEPANDFMMRLADNQVTHISGTPSHWRRALMSGHAWKITPGYVRMSGEIADQTTINWLRDAYPNASVAHAFASTEAGVAFDVRDGLAGFPVSFIDNPEHVGVELRVVDGTLRIRSPRTASGYIGRPLNESDGFVDTGDLVEQRGDRYFFVGRREGVINVGGKKVFPEEVEAAIMQHPIVRIARARGLPNMIMGAVVVADLVLREPMTDSRFFQFRAEMNTFCRGLLDRYKCPVTWFKVDSIPMSAAGKVQRGRST